MVIYFHYSTRMLFVNPIIDGTVEGSPTDLTVYADSEVLHDHTYYGNGCPNVWDDGKEGRGGSKTPCSSRTVETFDEETQAIGVYYTFQAATSGTGGAITTDNTNAPDTFCPLGWQMPYGGTDGDYYNKSKSWRYLIEGYRYDTIVTSISSYPISIIYSGDYYWAIGRLFSSGIQGAYWSSTVVGSYNSYRLFLKNNQLAISQPAGKINGPNVRCFLSLTARWQEIPQI